MSLLRHFDAQSFLRSTNAPKQIQSIIIRSFGTGLPLGSRTTLNRQLILYTPSCLRPACITGLVPNMKLVVKRNHGLRDDVCILKKFDLIIFLSSSFAILVSLLKFLTIIVPFWSISISLVFVYPNKLNDFEVSFSI